MQYLAEICDRYGISDRAGANIANAVLRDYGILQDNPCYVIALCKLRRERQRRGKLAGVINSRFNQAKPIGGVYYDGRDDKSLVGVDIEISGTIVHKTILQKETHDTIIAEPGHRYLDHFSPSTGKASDKAKEILYLIKERNADPVVIGSDGTPVNTCCRGDVIDLELGLGKRCQQDNLLTRRATLERTSTETCFPAL